MLSHNQTGNLIEVHYPLKSKTRLRFGSVAVFLSMLFVTYPEIHFVYSQISKKGELLFDSKQFKKALSDVNFEDSEFLSDFKTLIEAESAAIQDLA